MFKADYAGQVDSYICQNDGILGHELTISMRTMLEGERPLTCEDYERWCYSIDRHVEALLKRHPEAGK